MIRSCRMIYGFCRDLAPANIRSYRGAGSAAHAPACPTQTGTADRPRHNLDLPILATRQADWCPHMPICLWDRPRLSYPRQTGLAWVRQVRGAEVLKRVRMRDYEKSLYHCACLAFTTGFLFPSDLERSPMVIALLSACASSEPVANTSSTAMSFASLHTCSMSAPL